jgi:hypothetical protein
MGRAREASSTFLAAAALLVVALLAIALAGGPLATSDLWWHLKMGEVYLVEGLWPAADPMLHTAHERAPVQHEWLFSVATHGIDGVAGFGGLRLAHALAVAMLLAFAYAVFRREGAAAELTILATLSFGVLAWFRLMQLRADLVSIPATLAIYALLIAPAGPPSWRRVAASTVLFLVWANAHPLFAIGLILLLAALLGLGARAVLARRLAPPERATLRRTDARRALRLAAAFGAGLLASFLNPRGFEQHLTFHTASTTAGIWSLRDEWSYFHPFDWSGFGAALSVPAGVVADLLLLALPAAALFGVLRFWRRPSRKALEAVDPVRYALGFAGLCALLISIRFLWLGTFALAALLRMSAELQPARGQPLARRVVAAAAVGLATVHVFLVLRGSDARFLSPEAYLRTPYVTAGYHAAGVRFLRDAGLEGNLFNTYVEGGFVGYWLAPRLRTFVDGRTDHFSEEVLQEYFDVKGLRARSDGRSPLDVLARRRVDVFFGTGLPLAAAADWHVYTTAHLEDAPGWVPVFRALGQALYVRDDVRNRQNLRRVAAYYAARNIPFDPPGGFDPRAAAAANPRWAAAHQVVPLHWQRLEALRAAQDPARRLRALGEQALVLTLLGDYPGALALDREALALRPEALAPQRRRVFALLHLGREPEALAAARALRRTAPDDPRHRALEAAAERLSAARAARPTAAERSRILARLPLLDAQEAQRALAGRYAEVRLERGRAGARASSRAPAARSGWVQLRSRVSQIEVGGPAAPGR